jgi:hypothetical protein
MISRTRDFAASHERSSTLPDRWPSTCRREPTSPAPRRPRSPAVRDAGCIKCAIERITKRYERWQFRNQLGRRDARLVVAAIELRTGIRDPAAADPDGDQTNGYEKAADFAERKLESIGRCRVCQADSPPSISAAVPCSLVSIEAPRGLDVAVAPIDQEAGAPPKASGWSRCQCVQSAASTFHRAAPNPAVAARRSPDAGGARRDVA